jgi:alpha-tubulin suppressor-like RCC1 family protein
MYSKKKQNIEEKPTYVWAFGQNKDGELGLGNQQDAFLPVPINGFEPARSVSSGSHHTIMVTKSG